MAEPTLDFAHRGNCAAKGCDRPGVFQPVLLVWAKGFEKGSHPPAEMQIGMLLCKRHRRERDSPDLYLSDDGWAMIEEGFRAANRAAPDRSTVEITFRRRPARG